MHVNGEPHVLEGVENLTVKGLLSVCKVEYPEMVSVQLNGLFVPRERFSAQRVSEGDQVDFLYFIGGGGK